MNRRSTPLHFAAGTLLLLTLIVGSYLLPAGAWALGLVSWIQNAGAAGVVALVVAYVVGTILLLPGSLLTLGAGFAYGPILGTLVVWPAATLAATAAFLTARFVARERVRRLVENHPRFAAVDRSVGQNGFKIVLLLRLSPIFPFNLLNYALGLTGVPLPHYVLASAVGMLPGAAVFAYLGSLATTAATLTDGTSASGPAHWLLYGVGFIATVAVSAILTRIARSELRRTLDDPAVRSAAG